ncbi:MAG TPA: phosphoserine phosphatase SerB [Nitrososphaerales archaeon]
MIIIFDIEGVLIDAEFFPELGKILKIEDEIADITFKGIRGEIDWTEGLIKRLEKIKKTPYEMCLQVCNNLPYMRGAKEVCRKLKESGWTIVAVSGGPTMLSDRVAKELDLDYVFGNELIFINGRLQTMDIKVGADKSAAVRSLINGIGEKKENMVAVIDGANDIKLLNLVSVSIAFNSSKYVEEQTDYVIKEKNLNLILPILERMSNKLI